MEETADAISEGPEISLEYFVFLALITGLITFFVWIRGYYKFSEEIENEPKKATLLQTFMAFLLFFSPALLLVPVFRQALSFLTSYPYLRSSLHSIAIILSVCLTACILCLFSKQNIFKNIPQLSFGPFFKGVSTWLIAYPQMVIISAIISFVITSVFGLVPNEQSAVLELKQAKDENIFVFFLLLLTVSLIVPICEEILFRGYLQSFFKNMFSRLTAVILASIVFALFHFSSAQGSGNLIILPSLFFLSLYLGLVYEKSGSIAAPIGLHATFNFISTLMIIQQT